MPGFAFAVEANTADSAANPEAGRQFGVVWRIRGDVVAEGGASIKAHPLHEGSPVYVGEHIRSGATGEAVIKTGDAGIVAVRPGTEFIPERFAADGKKTDNLTVRLVVGSLRMITGWIGKLNRDEHRVVTATATIGVRGTDHEPYVLSPDMAQSTPYKAGTYDKVNRGRTSLGEGDSQLEIDPGQVGFARQRTFAPKGLMTILMPVLLDKVPDFYVPGQFDAELDQYSLTADAESARQLEQKLKTSPAAPAPAPVPAPVSAPVAAPASVPGAAPVAAPASSPVSVSACAPAAIAKKWLRSFDGAVEKRDAPAILALFAPDVAVRATVRTGDGGTATVDMTREELVHGTIAAMKGLTHYRQRRLTLDAWQTTPSSCNSIGLRSSVVEQGRQSGKPYRFESTEQYVLEQRDGKWLAVKAETTPR